LQEVWYEEQHSCQQNWSGLVSPFFTKTSGFAGQKFKLQNLMNPNRLVGRFDRLVLARAEEMHGEMKNGKKNVKRIGIPFAKYL
jgi:hypothetical protein